MMDVCGRSGVPKSECTWKCVNCLSHYTACPDLVTLHRMRDAILKRWPRPKCYEIPEASIPTDHMRRNDKIGNKDGD